MALVRKGGRFLVSDFMRSENSLSGLMVQREFTAPRLLDSIAPCGGGLLSVYVYMPAEGMVTVVAAKRRAMVLIIRPGKKIRAVDFIKFLLWSLVLRSGFGSARESSRGAIN